MIRGMEEAEPPRFNPELTAALEAIGVVDPNGCKWRMFKYDRPRDPPLPRMCAAEWICQCTGVHRRVTMVPFAGMSRPMLLGQCSDCRVVRWKYWGGTWTGTTTLEPSRPMYEKGYGASHGALPNRG